MWRAPRLTRGIGSELASRAAATAAASSPSCPDQGAVRPELHPGRALKLLALEDDLAAERALTARLHTQLAGQDPRDS